MQLNPKYEVAGEPTNQKWLGSAHATSNARTVTLDGTKLAKFDKNYIPAGTPVKAADGGKFAPVTSASDELAGFVLVDQPFAGSGDVIAPLLDHGRIRVDYLPEGTFDVTTLPANPHFIFVKEAN